MAGVSSFGLSQWPPQTKSGRSIPRHMAQNVRITCLEMWALCHTCSKTCSPNRYPFTFFILHNCSRPHKHKNKHTINAAWMWFIFNLNNNQIRQILFNPGGNMIPTSPDKWNKSRFFYTVFSMTYFKKKWFSPLRRTIFHIFRHRSSFKEETAENTEKCLF
jgi:hypothetical protein